MDIAWCIKFCANHDKNDHVVNAVITRSISPDENKNIGKVFRDIQESYFSFKNLILDYVITFSHHAAANHNFTSSYQ